MAPLSITTNIDSPPLTLQPAPTRKEPNPNYWPIPHLHFQVLDVSSPGSGIFFASVQNVPAILKDSVVRVLGNLFPTPETAPTNVRSISLILRKMEGVAYTRGSNLDNDHKEIHFSTDYIQSVSSSRAHDEIFGVLVHEIVHCFQYNANGTCPAGLVEGIADWVRLKAGLAPPHWRRRGGIDLFWDQGYEITGYFLDWIDSRRYDAPTVVDSGSNPNNIITVTRHNQTPAADDHSSSTSQRCQCCQLDQSPDSRSGSSSSSSPSFPSFVQKLNESLRDVDYDESIFVKLTGKSVQDLWEEYISDMNEGGGGGEAEEPGPSGAVGVNN